MHVNQTHRIRGEKKKNQQNIKITFWHLGELSQTTAPISREIGKLAHTLNT